MVYYWRGKLDDEAGRNLLQKFWKAAPARTRGHAIWFLGHTLEDRSVQVSLQQLERLQSIWNDRLSEEAADKAEELSYFGSWFASGRFPTRWSIEKLRETMAQSRALKDRDDVLGALPASATAEPLLTAQTLRDLIEITKEPWAINRKAEEIRQTLALLVASADEDAAKCARECVDLLAARGHLSFRDALGPGNSLLA